eukprot:m.10206 g.10206  ORF g.10206 m.10206 type:complete len:545 (+) comp4220_c0_seq2:22-1656(+)
MALSLSMLLSLCLAMGAMSKPMNFIFVFPDTLRAESHSGYADANHLLPKNVTPNLERFAKTGTRFEQAHVMHTQCSPSRCTMMTGRYMHVLGHRTQTHLIQDYEQNYFRSLKEGGYHVQFFGKNDAFSANAFNLSVTEWQSLIGYSSGKPIVPFPQAGYFSFLSQGSTNPPESGGDYEGMMAGIDFITNKPPEPFFLFIPSRGAHPPYGGPLGFHNKFTVADVKASGWVPRDRNIEGMPTYMRNDIGIPHYRNLTSLDDDFFYQIQAVYLGMVSYTDWLFGKMLDALETADGGTLKDRTALFFSSDHGDFGGDYGLVEKWPGSMADVLTRVPLYARIPGGTPGHVSKAPVQTADILETMLDLANLTQNNTWIRFGESLKTQLMGGEGDMGRFVYSEGGFYFENEQMIEANECLSACPAGMYCPRGQEEASKNGSPRAAMIRNLTAKLVHRPTGMSELYDLAADPRETNNLWNNPKSQNLQVEMVQKLLDWMVLTSDVTPVSLDSRGPPKYPFPIPPGDPWAKPGTMQPQEDVMDYYSVNGITTD